jgi:hypothetical protein
MKKCPWCGKEYPDEILVCAIDQNPLESSDAAPASASDKSATDSADVTDAFSFRDASRPDIYEFFGTYSNEDARLLLDAFVSDDIDYTFDLDKMGIQDISAFQAANGGTFGAGVGIAIGVHIDDCDQASAIRQRVLKIMP